VALPTNGMGICEQLGLGDVVQLGTDGDEIVHSAKWPVVGSRAWVVDFEDFGHPLLVGHCAWNPELMAREGPVATRTAAFRDCLHKRVRNMCTALAHNSCKAILLYTQHERDEMDRLLLGLDLGAWRQAILAKCHVLYPAVKAMPRAWVERKWHRTSPLRVLFCGRDYEWKKGALALRVLARLRETRAIEAVYIGDIPSSVRESHPDWLDRVELFPALMRLEVLKHLARAHVLLHPSKSESLGSVFFEAASAGAVVVCGKGPGLPHIGELLDDSSALFVDRTDPAIDEEPAFEECLRTLCDDDALARRLGLAAYELAVEGRLSISARDRVLLEVYQQCRDATDGSPLAPADLPYYGDAGQIWMGSADTLLDMRNAYRHSIGAASNLVHVGIELDGPDACGEHVTRNERGDGIH
jgi:glycosyltransferase involved in cell wall biosynthesis